MLFLILSSCEKRNHIPIIDNQTFTVDENSLPGTLVGQTSIEIWINGKICTKKAREYTSYNTSASGPVLIGNNYDIGEGINNHFNGKLDELRVYNRGLTVDEIRTLFKE